MMIVNMEFVYATEVWAATCCVEGCRDMLELAKALRDEADKIQRLHKAGFRMSAPVDTGRTSFGKDLTSGDSSDICAYSNVSEGLVAPEPGPSTL